MRLFTATVMAMGMTFIALSIPIASAYTYHVPESAPVDGQWPLALQGRNESVNVTLYDYYGTVSWNQNVSLNDTHQSDVLWLPAPHWEGNYLLRMEGWTRDANGTYAAGWVILRSLAASCGVECHMGRVAAIERANGDALAAAVLWGLVAVGVIYATAREAREFLLERRGTMGFSLKAPRLVVMPDDMPRMRPEYLRLDAERRVFRRDAERASSRESTAAAEIATLLDSGSSLYGRTESSHLARLERKRRVEASATRKATRGYWQTVRRMNALVPHGPPADRHGAPWQFLASVASRIARAEKEEARLLLRERGEEVPDALRR